MCSLMGIGSDCFSTLYGMLKKKSKMRDKNHLNQVSYVGSYYFGGFSRVFAAKV